jgi:hypothetical protein
MTAISYIITANGSSYTGSLFVVIKDVNNSTVYSGSVTTWSSTIGLPQLPVSISVTPNTTFVPVSLSNITTTANIAINLMPPQQSPVVYNVMVAGAVYKGAVNVVIYDVNNTLVYNGTNQTYSSTILSSRFPISMTVTPTVNYLA